MRSFQGLRLGDLLLLHLPALLQDEALLLAQDARPFVGDLALLLGLGERLVLVDLQHREASFQTAPANRERRRLRGLVTLVAGRLLAGHHHRGAIDVRHLARLLLGDELDLLVRPGLLARKLTRDLDQLLLLRLVDQHDAPVALRALLGELALDVGELLLLGLRDQLDLPVPARLLQLQRLVDLRRLAAPALLGGVHVALGAHALQCLLVVDLLLLDLHALVEHVYLLVADLLRLLVGDLAVLIGARERLLLLDLQQLELGVELALADGDRGALLGVVDLAPRVGGDRGDDLQALGVEHVVLVEELLAALLQGDDGDFFQREPVGVEALDHAVLDRLREGVAVLVELAQGLGGGKAAQRADDLGFEEVADLLGVEGALAQAAGGGEQVVLAAADVRVQLRHHVDPDLVRREHRLVARAADDELQRLQGDPRDLVEYRQDQCAAAQAHLGAEIPGTDEPHVGGRPLVDPDRDDVEDRDQDDHEEDEGNQKFRGHGRSIAVWSLGILEGDSSFYSSRISRDACRLVLPGASKHVADIPGSAPCREVGRISRRRNPTVKPRVGRFPMSDYAALIRPTQV